MKNFVLTFIFVFFSAALPAQGISRALTTYFTYDGSGNMTSRKHPHPTISPGKGEQPGKDISGDITVVRDGDKYTIHLAKDYGAAVSMQVYDVSPVTVKDEEFTGLQHTFDMSGNPDGVYILKVSVENNEGTKKIVKD